MSFTGLQSENKELRRIGAALGVSVTAGTPVFTQLLPNTQYVSVVPTLTTAVVAEIRRSPWLTILLTADDLATAPTDASANAQDASATTSVTLSSMSTLANGDALYVGSWVPFQGVDIDIDAANATASVLTVSYWNGSAWVDISDTDGTASGGATMAQDGQVTWTVPTAWAKASLRGIAAALQDGHEVANSVSFDYVNIPHYWTRWTVSVALDSSTTADHMLAINRSDAEFEMRTLERWESYTNWGVGGYSAIEADCNAGSALILMAAGSGQGVFTS